MIYLSSSASLVQLEYLSILGAAVMKTPRHMIIYEIADESLIASLDKRSLPADWSILPHGRATQEFGRDWLARREEPFLRVPSARIGLAFYPEECSLLVNAEFRWLAKSMRVVERVSVHWVLNR